LSTVQYNGVAVKIEVDIPIPEESVDESAKERLRHDALEAAVFGSSMSAAFPRPKPPTIWG
jgi:hypothetical protein